MINLSPQRTKLYEMYNHWFECDPEGLTDLQACEKIAIEIFLAGEDAKSHGFDSYEVWLTQWAIRGIREGSLLDECNGWNQIEMDEDD